MPDTVHMALTVNEVDPATLEANSNAALFCGSHFLTFNTMHRTLLGRFRTHLWLNYITNAEHYDSEMYVHRMMIAVKLHRKNILREMQHGDLINDQQRHLTWMGILPLLSLIWMCLSADYFDVPGIEHPQTFLDQRHNARLLAWETLEEYHQTEGELGDLLRLSWSQLVDEMNDRLIHKDDVISPARRLLQASNALSPPPRPKGFKLHPLPTGVFDPRNEGNLMAFYANFTPKPSPHKTKRLNDQLPERLFAWSNLAEGTTAATPDGTAYSTGSSITGGRSYPIDVLNIRRGTLQSNVPQVEAQSELITPAWYNKSIWSVEEVVAKKSSELGDPAWIFRQEGGSPFSQEQWIGYMRQEVEEPESEDNT